uniref:Retroviral envelope protein GP41-like domain-containing protein n=1 Tax=Rousettus aegyptiacus TaxID=9407 RepID=A0A7J8HR84_ROUAE|nr:hypothetical protein HJG63_010997 [Rousettus aegyptiacus]
MVGLIIAEILAIVSLIATAATAAVELSQIVQTPHYVNDLSKNVTMALGTQENIDNKLEQKLDALYSLVMYLGDEIQGLEVRSHLECHAVYHWICVISKIYKENQFGWDRVRSHLQGVWHNANTSLDLIQLHMEIQGLRDARTLQFDAAEAASKFLQQLKESLPSWSSFTHLAISVFALGLCMMVSLCLLPTLLKYFLNSFLRIHAEMYGLRLQAQV